MAAILNLSGILIGTVGSFFGFYYLFDGNSRLTDRTNEGHLASSAWIARAVQRAEEADAGPEESGRGGQSQAVVVW